MYGERRIAQLEQALEPFARMARDNPKRGRSKGEPVVGVYIPWKLLDDAAAVLKGSTSNTGGEA